MPWRINSRLTQTIPAQKLVDNSFREDFRTSLSLSNEASRKISPLLIGQVSQLQQKVFMNKHGIYALFILSMIFFTGCSSGSSATRTPVPTWTPTPAGATQTDNGQAQPAGQAQADTSGGESSLAIAAAPASDGQANTTTVVEPAPVDPGPQPAGAAVAEASTPIPAEEPTVIPEPTEAPTEPPTEPPTVVPTATPTPSGPQYEFELESADKFPTDSLAENVVRIFLYVYGGGEFALPGYSLVVAHNESSLPVDGVSTAGLPSVTRDEPGIYTRFTNMNAIFIEPQAGTWAIQLVDESGVAVGPPAFLELEPNDNARELYVRYRRK